MILKKLLLRNFRNFSEKTFSFSSGVNLIHGENAKGKTNILEAIYLLSTGRSFRTPILKDLIKHKEKYFYIEATILKDLVTHTLKIFFDPNKKKIVYNSNTLSSFSSLLGIIPSVMHSPSDIDLIRHSPSVRRRFLNIHLVQHDKLYLHHLTRFFKALKERNHLLKTSMISNIGLWEDQMARSTAYISFARASLIKALEVPLNQTQEKLNRKEKIQLRYTPAHYYQKDVKETFNLYLEQLKKNRKKDLMLKTTQFGSHRDDFLIYIDKKEAKNFASEGQKRSITTSLRLAEYNILSKNIKGPAIMNMDDLVIHLDKNRISNLISILEPLNQVFITNPNSLEIKGNVIHLTDS